MSSFPKLESKAQAVSSDIGLFPIFQDSSKKLIPSKNEAASLLEKLKKESAFNASYKSSQFTAFAEIDSAKHALFLGVGQAIEVTEEKFRTMGAQAYAKCEAEKLKVVTLFADSVFDQKNISSQTDHAKLIHAFLEGFFLKCYSFKKHKSEATETFVPSKLIVVTQEKSLAAHLPSIFKTVLATAESMAITRDWSNEPSNFGTPGYYASEAKRLSKKYGLKCTVMNAAAAKKAKMDLFLSVGAGGGTGDRAPHFVIVEYAPKSAKGAKTLAYVGKGVTFDTGGISIKPSAKMEDMKHDMTGAATVFGATVLASLLKVPNKIVCLMVFTENMPSGTATCPGNIVKARNGKTVEIINTDAEGRLILADALDYANIYKPDAIIDVATLTGACGIALGKLACAVLGNDEALIAQLKDMGDRKHERMWQLPLFDEYLEDMKSDYADLKNVGNDGMGGTIRGAIFLKEFVKKGTPWAHLDIAYTSHDCPQHAYFPRRGATGAHVRTLAEFAAEF